MYDLAVFIYQDKSFKKAVGSYRALFEVVPRVGDFIGYHIRIEKSKTCRVELVYVIPRDDQSTTDAHAIIKAIVVKEIEFP